MASYCESDVKLLKAGCQKFQEEFETKAEFNPFVKCVTIASACHRFWRKNLVPLDTVASEPCQGWRGAQSNQSLKALKWMTGHVVRDPPDRPHPTHAQRGRTAPSRQVPRGRLRRQHPYHLRVSRLSVARVSALFPKATPPVYQNAPRSYPTRNVRGHQTQTRRVARTRIPSRHHVGVRLGPR